MDWGIGSYEHTAAELAPAAEVTVDHLAPRPGERIVDLGCGTGNALLVAAGAGASVLGVDPSQRLLEVALSRATEAGIEAEVALGEASSIPAADRSVDAIVSVFGLIFAPDAPAAAAEMGRVLSPSGRLVYSAWLPRGVLAEQMARRRAAMADLVPAPPPGPPPMAWHERPAVEELLGPLGFSVSLQEHRIPFRGESPAAYVEGQLASHPMWLEARAVLEPAGRWDEVRDDTLAFFTAANEDPTGFQVTSDYVVVTATRQR